MRNIKTETFPRAYHSTPNSAGSTKMLTRFSLAVVAVGLFVMAERPPLDEIQARCRDEYHLLQEQVPEINKTRKLETNDQNVKCFLKCFLTGVGVMSENGDIVLGDPSEVKYHKIYPCKDITGTDSCDKALNLQNCIWKLLEKEERDDAE